MNNIDNNVNQLRNKKKIEIRQVNSHNDKVDNNNKSIVIYSIIEIFTMIIIFIAQSYYISSFVAKNSNNENTNFRPIRVFNFSSIFCM